MTFIAIFLGTIVAVFLIVLYIWFRISNAIKRSVGPVGYKMFKDRFKEALDKGEIWDGDFEADQKSISGMTEILEAKIRRDFDDFHASELFNLNNKCLRAIFNSLEERSISHLDNDCVYDLIKTNIYEQIQDMIGRDIEVSYDDIRINKNTLSSYSNKDGSATIVVNTSLSYFYKTNSKKEKSYDKFRKQTRFTTKFILVYDAEKFDGKSVTYAVNCPNCGAPTPSNGGECKYCGTYVEGVNLNTINLKSWRIISYKEY